LTFADLAKAGVSLQMVTTDLSYGRPLVLPPPADNEYLFDLEEWECFFPEAVITELERIPETEIRSPRNKDRRLRKLPGPELPIVVAARLSLSYPMLLSALPMYSVVSGDTGFLSEPAGEQLVIIHWFSDGGISSNFPIHFFDSWMPSWPTFGLDLQPYPDKRLAARLPQIDRAPVYMPTSPLEQSLPHWSSVDGIGGFFRQMFDAARNWRDALQGEMPGSRERVCHVRLSNDEGGLNLEMDSAIVEGLLDRGADAGRAIHDNFEWEQHRFTRYLTLMNLLQSNLVESGEEARFPQFATRLRRGGFTYFGRGHDSAWCASAADLTAALLNEAESWMRASRTSAAHADRWPNPPLGGFGGGDQPMPQPTMKVVPRA
jgi:hypothetical protein